MVVVGGNSEQKPIGLKFGVSGTHNNTELVNGKVQLKQIGVDWDNSPIYAETGTWTSDIIDIGDNFADFGKVFTSNINQGDSSITIETRTSSNGTTFSEWKFVDLDGTILSQKNKYIQVRVNFFVDKSVKEKVITNFNSYFIDSSNGIKLKTEYNFDMTKDGTWLEEGSLHKKSIVRSDWQQIDKLNVPTSAGNVNKSLILNQGEYKKWNEKVEKSEIIRNPIMTSNNTPVPYLVSASSIYSSSYEPYKMINLSLGSGNYWISKSGKFVDEWVLMDFGQPTNLTSIGLSHLSSGELSAMPKEVTLSASNDNINFIHLSSLTNQSNWQTNEIRELTFERSSFRYYKLTMTGNGTRTYVSVSKLYFIDEIIGRPSHWSIISTAIPTSQQFLSDGMDSLSPLLDRRVEELEPLIMTDKSDIITENGKVFSKTLDLKKYKDIRNLSVNTTGQIKLCNVGDYENTINYTTVSDIYNNFNNIVEVLVFTNETVIDVSLKLEAIWSPIDELNGDFEVVTWTDENKATAQRTLELSSIPTPKFIYPSTVTNIIGDLQGLNIQGDGRYLLTHNNSQWFKWNGVDFSPVNVQNVNTEGMTSQEAMSADYSKWIYDKINIGLFIENNDVVDHVGISQLLPNKTSALSNINFYILNTTARIDLELAGLTLTGNLSDADLTRVQYKVTLNDKPFFPLNGEFTALSEPPQNINIVMKTSDIKMMDWNTLRVDFRDYFGTEDYWQTTFVGNYASLMFKDVDGNYYSDDVGKVLQYLDFGNIVAGEVTVSHEIILKNQYGYAVKDVEIVPNTSYLPEGVLIEMSKTNNPFIPESDLLYTEGLADNEELSFFVRMNTDVNSIPNEHNKFDVFVKASRKDV